MKLVDHANAKAATPAIISQTGQVSATTVQDNKAKPLTNVGSINASHPTAVINPVDAVAMRIMPVTNLGCSFVNATTFQTVPASISIKGASTGLIADQTAW